MNFNKEIKPKTHANIGLYLSIEAIEQLRKLSKQQKKSMNKIVEELIKKESL
jgi:hypothetical protein